MNRSTLIAQKAANVVESCKKSGISIRVLAACAIRIHCPNSVDLLDQMQREISDIDFISLTKHVSDIRKQFEKLGYDTSHDTSRYYAHLYGQVRNRFKEPETGVNVDIFYDKLEMCHTIDLRNRLELDFPTIPVSDLLLAKMQIVEINKKDINDALVLIREHPVSESEQNSIDSRYIASLLAEDWGFYYTVTANLHKLIEHLDSIPILRSSEGQVRGNIDLLLKAIDSQPKSFRWKARARVGTRKKWYKEVEEVSMVPPAER